MTAAQFRDLTQARIAIEGHAAALAAKTRNDGDLKSIVEAEAAMRAESRAAKPNLPRAVELNKSFHFAVYEAAHSATLVEIIRALWLKAGPVINLDLRANPERLAKGDAVRFHANVLAAIKAGDEAGAREGIAADISSAAEVILSRGGLAEQ
jgi:DNA-binding GntR family transcriptional regulator